MDIDIDTPTTFDPLDLFNIIKASKFNNSELTKHPSGVYFQNIPSDPVTDLSAIPFNEAEQYNYFKVDFLHLSILDKCKSKQQIRDLIKKEPDWSLLQNKEIVSQLFQINRQFDFISEMAPKSVDDLADCLALLRPGKKHLLNEYLINKERTRPKLYQKTDKYYYKKGHAISYALTIVLQLHLLKEEQALFKPDELLEF